MQPVTDQRRGPEANDPRVFNPNTDGMLARRGWVAVRYNYDQGVNDRNEAIVTGELPGHLRHSELKFFYTRDDATGGWLVYDPARVEIRRETFQSAMETGPGTDRLESEGWTRVDDSYPGILEVHFVRARAQT